MAHEMKYFRNKLTGLSGEYPADFGDLFPDFEEVDPNEAYCVDCVVDSDGNTISGIVEDEDEAFLDPDHDVELIDTDYKFEDDDKFDFEDKGKDK